LNSERDGLPTHLPGLSGEQRGRNTGYRGADLTRWNDVQRPVLAHCAPADRTLANSSVVVAGNYGYGPIHALPHRSSRIACRRAFIARISSRSAHWELSIAGLPARIIRRYRPLS